MTMLTFSQAKNISLDVWKHATKHGYKPEGKKLYKIVNKYAPLFDGLDNKRKYVSLDCSCGFCEYFNVRKNGCQACPLYWEAPVKEDDSEYDVGNVPCSRTFWKWAFCADRNDIDGMKRWAKIMYEEISEL